MFSISHPHTNNEKPAKTAQPELTPSTGGLQMKSRYRIEYSHSSGVGNMERVNRSPNTGLGA